MRTVLITLIAPDHTADLVVDADTPLQELLPSLLAAGRVQADPGLENSDGWSVAVMGRQPIGPDQTLEAAEVLDGAVLVLRRVSAAGESATTPLPAVAGAGSPLAQTRALLRNAGAPFEEFIAKAQMSRCVTMAVLSPKGGVGKTVLSVLLGELLCSLRSGESLVLDADGDFGSLGRIPPGEFDAAAARQDGGIFSRLTQGSVTFAELDRRVWKFPGGLRVVPSPSDPTAMAHADRAAYTRVVGGLQRLADTLVVDCGTGLGQPGVQAAVLASDVLVLVTDPSSSTVALTAEAGALLARSGRPVVVVLNRAGVRGGSDELERLDRLFPWAAALVAIPEEPTLAQVLTGNFALVDAPRRLQVAATELLAVLAALWHAQQ